MKAILAAALIGGFVTSGLATARDGQQLFDDFRCAACHGKDGKGNGATVKSAKPIAGTESSVTYAVIMKMIGGGGSHASESCEAVPTDAQVKAISEYVAALPR